MQGGRGDRERAAGLVEGVERGTGGAAFVDAVADGGEGKEDDSRGGGERFEGKCKVEEEMGKVGDGRDVCCALSLT